MSDDMLDFLQIPAESLHYSDFWLHLTHGGKLLAELQQMMNNHCPEAQFARCRDLIQQWKDLDFKDVSQHSADTAIKLVQTAAWALDSYPSSADLQKKVEQAGQKWEPWQWAVYRYLRGIDQTDLQSITSDVLLIDQAKDVGMIGELTLRAVPGGSGELCLSPDSLFMECDRDFKDSLDHARAYLSSLKWWAPTYDFTWQIKRRGRVGLRYIKGPSAGLTITLSLIRLLSMINPDDPALERYRKLLEDPGIKYTAGITAEGNLRPVGGVFAKLLEAARTHSLPFCHTVIVAEGQKDVPRDLHIQDNSPNAEFQVNSAITLTNVLELLDVSRVTHWGQVLDCRVELKRHQNFIGRTWLVQKIENYLTTRRSGYFVILGSPGMGKSAFVADRIQRGERLTAYHFIKKGMGNWDDPEVFLGSLIAQIRISYRLPPLEGESGLILGGVLQSVLQRASDRVQKLSTDIKHRIVIYLDGIDEAFGPTSRFAGISMSTILPQILPSGVFIVLTSRPGAHINWLSYPVEYKCENLDQAEYSGAL